MPLFETISEEAIAALVDTFYGKVAEDPDLGPVFARVIGDWPPHLAKMRAFWSSVMLRTGVYVGNPMAAHLALAGVEPRLFDRWLALFDETLAQLFAAPIAARFAGKARTIANALRSRMFPELPPAPFAPFPNERAPEG